MFIKIGSFLPSAFSRIDRRGVLKEQKDIKNIEDVLENILHVKEKNISVKYHDGVIVLYSVTPIIKQKIFLQKEKIITEVSKKLPTLNIKDIRFKG